MSAAPLRRDAARNRGRLLAAASELFAERGLQVTLNDIAVRAGLGAGTAYRRFVNREEVMEAIFEMRLQQLLALAEQAGQEELAWVGLVGFLERSSLMQSMDRGLSDVMISSPAGCPRIQECRERIAAQVGRLLALAKEQGSIRRDVEQLDVHLLWMALAGINERAPGVATELSRRHLTVWLDGIRDPRGRCAP